MSHWLDETARGLARGTYSRRDVLRRGGAAAGGALVGSVAGPFHGLAFARAARRRCKPDEKELVCAGLHHGCQPRSTECCGVRAYDPKTEHCCEDQHTGAAQEVACRKNQTCCKERDGNFTCCDKDEKCLTCDGEDYGCQPSDMKCCGTEAMDPEKDQCCTDSQGHKTKCLKSQQCCGSLCLDDYMYCCGETGCFNVDVCCTTASGKMCCGNGQVCLTCGSAYGACYDEGFACCGANVYNTSTQECCTSGDIAYVAPSGQCCANDQHLVGCGSGSSICCPLDEYCCGGTCCASANCVNDTCQPPTCSSENCDGFCCQNPDNPNDPGTCCNGSMCCQGDPSFGCDTSTSVAICCSEGTGCCNSYNSPCGVCVTADNPVC